MIDLGRALKAPFNDTDWVSKTLLSFVWGLLGLLLFPLLAVFTGVQVEYVRRVSRGDERIPDWSEFGKKWTEGLVVWVAGLIYFLPVLVVAVMAFAPAIFAGAQSEGIADSLLAGSACLFTVVALVYGVAVSILYQAALVNYAMRGGFGSLFAIGEILRLVRGGTGYWAAWGYSIVVSFGISAVTSILSGTVVGGLLYPAILYLGNLMMAHLLGQWARSAYGLAPAGLEGPLPPAPPAAFIPQPPAPPVWQGPSAQPQAPAPPAYPAPPAPPAPPAAPQPPAPPAPPEQP